MLRCVCPCRADAPQPGKGARSLSGRHQSISDHLHRLPHVPQESFARPGLRLHPSETQRHLTEHELHASVGRIRETTAVNGNKADHRLALHLLFIIRIPESSGSCCFPFGHHFSSSSSLSFLWTHRTILVRSVRLLVWSTQLPVRLGRVRFSVPRPETWKDRAASQALISGPRTPASDSLVMDSRFRISGAVQDDLSIDGIRTDTMAKKARWRCFSVYPRNNWNHLSIQPLPSITQSTAAVYLMEINAPV